jgi:chromate transporter
MMAGYASQTASNNNWKHRKLYNLFENNYRFSSLVFGGGDVLMPMMYEQYVVRPQTEVILRSKRDVLKMEKEDFLTGYGMVRAIPGPVFSIGAFTGGMLVRSENNNFTQLLGCVLGAIAIFLPSALLVLFFFPIWNNLKKYVVIYRSLEGINAAVVGIMFGAFFYLLKDFCLTNILDNKIDGWISLAVIGCTFSLLYKTKIPPPYVVLICLAIGWFV